MINYTFDTYQMEASATSLCPQVGDIPGVYAALGLNGEAGELAEKIKKFWRDNGDYFNTRTQVKKELGDVLWYTAELASAWALTLSEVAEHNIEKLKDRAERNVIHGSGDER